MYANYTANLLAIVMSKGPAVPVQSSRAIEFRPSSKTKKTHIHLTFEPTNIIPKTPSLPDRDETCSFLKKTVENLTF